jgi:hypothetical protein
MQLLYWKQMLAFWRDESGTTMGKDCEGLREVSQLGNDALTIMFSLKQTPVF